ncbi:MAG: ASCH domain-containing protein [Candidatus Pacearchaeota archaeon]
MGNVLHLTLFKQWFDEILAGTKKIEYREVKPFWKKRLFTPEGNVRKYDEVIFTNGYGTKRPRMRVEFIGVREANNKYEILLGKVTETLNL